MDFLSPHESVEVLLPEFPQETKAPVALVKIDQKLHSENFPDVENRYMAAPLTKSDVGIEGKNGRLFGEISEGIAVEVIAVGKIGCKIRIGPVGSYQAQEPSRSCDPVKLTHDCCGVGDVFDDVTTYDFVEAIVRERVRNIVKVVDDVGRGSRVDIHSDCPGSLVFSTANIQHAEICRILFRRSIELGGFHELV